MIEQVRFELKSKTRVCHLVTREILEHLPQPLPKAGLLNLFVQHTSCALSINENADPDVRTDMAKILDRLVKENEPYYDHILEGADDMPAHAKCSMFGVSLTIPITDGRLNLGTWQGIYLCEFRDYGGPRKIIATIYS
jgi:secondary thiamine-phosphate synthase enzyme